MKKIILAAVSCILFSNAIAQGKHLRAYCDRQCTIEKTQITIPGFVLRLCADEPELKPFMKGLRSLRIVAMEKLEKDLWEGSGFDRALRLDGYEELLSIKESGEQFGIYISGTEERINSILLAVKDKAELVLLSAKVNMTMQQLEKLLSGDGRQQLKGLVSLR